MVKLSEDEVWGKLIPANSTFPTIELKLKETRVRSNTRDSSFKKEMWCIITRTVDLCAVIQNCSSRTLRVDKLEVPHLHSALLRSGNSVLLGLPLEGYMNFRFEIVDVEEPSKHLQVSLDVDLAKCGICLGIWRDVLTIGPCMHNFCKGCLLKWLGRANSCPKCRAVMKFVGSNHFLKSIEKEIMLMEPSLIRLIDDEGSNVSIDLAMQVPNNQRGRSESDLCRQCGDEPVGGFHCAPTTVHFRCKSCSDLMPYRRSINVPQICLGCDEPFCYPYWRSQGLHSGCSTETFLPIEEWTITMIPTWAHEGNEYEQCITEACFELIGGASLQDIVAELIVRFCEGCYDNSRLRLNNRDAINHRTYTCLHCYEVFVCFLLHEFRVHLPLDFMPKGTEYRENCPFGYVCWKQHRDSKHARKCNHACNPRGCT